MGTTGEDRKEIERVDEELPPPPSLAGAWRPLAEEELPPPPLAGAWRPLAEEELNRFPRAGA